MKKTIPIVIIVMLICAVGLVLFLLPEKEQFNIQNYLHIQELGSDTYGSVTVTLNNKKLYSDYESKLNKAGISTEDIQDMITVQYTDAETLSNGQTIEIVVSEKAKENVLISDVIHENINNTIHYTMNKLQAMEEYNPFDDLIVKPQGFHGAGSITAHIEHYGIKASWEWPVVIESNNENLSNGDKVILTVDVDKNEMEKKYGIKISTMETEYKVHTLTSYLESGDDLNQISADNIAILDKIIEDWVISGQNDENIGGYERTYEYETSILLTKQFDSRICFIYHIKDGYVPDGYYVYISPNYTVLVDNEHNTLMTGDKRQLSDSFAKYDKDTVRYTEKWGWGQDYERQGFMYEETPYAGKQTLEDMIEYLRTWYSEYDTMYRQY